MKKRILCFFILIFISVILAAVNEHNNLNSIEVVNTHGKMNYVELKITIAEDEIGNVSIFNIKGQKVSTEQYTSGMHSFLLKKSQYGSGLFFYRLKTNSYFKSGKIVMLK